MFVAIQLIIQMYT